MKFFITCFRYWLNCSYFLAWRLMKSSFSCCLFANWSLSPLIMATKGSDGTSPTVASCLVLRSNSRTLNNKWKWLLLVFHPICSNLLPWGWEGPWSCIWDRRWSGNRVSCLYRTSRLSWAGLRSWPVLEGMRNRKNRGRRSTWHFCWRRSLRQRSTQQSLRIRFHCASFYRTLFQLCWGATRPDSLSCHGWY